MSITDTIRRHILDDLGFDLVGIAPAERMEREGAQLEEWLALRFHGTMGWMENNVDKRIDVRAILPSAKSVIVVARNYYTPHRHSDAPDAAKISRYAWGTDYHKILPKKLKALDRHIRSIVPDAESRYYVDTGPVLEKQWAVRAGLGWMGKHSNVINRDLGSWVFLGVYITSLELDYDSPIADFCGSCTLCLDACPTGAIVEPYVVDANRCISYLTIEQKPDVPIAPELGATFENWAFGCDICQDVCPWNRFQKPTDEPAFEPRPGVLELTVSDVRAISDEEFQQRFSGSPVKRTKVEGLRRNARALPGTPGTPGNAAVPAAPDL